MPDKLLEAESTADRQLAVMCLQHCHAIPVADCNMSASLGVFAQASCPCCLFGAVALLQAYMCSVANHPALQGSDVLQLFLSQSGDLSSCSRWQQLIQHPAPADILLGLLKQSRQQRNSSAPADNASGASGAGSSSSSSNPLGMVMRMKHSLMNVVQPKAKPEVPADEQQLQQAKEWFK